MHKTSDLSSIYRLEFYKKKEDWKFRNGARKESEKLKSKEKSLDQTYNLEALDQAPPALNEAFLECSDKDLPFLNNSTRTPTKATKSCPNTAQEHNTKDNPKPSKFLSIKRNLKSPKIKFSLRNTKSNPKTLPSAKGHQPSLTPIKDLVKDDICAKSTSYLKKEAVTTEKKDYKSKIPILNSTNRSPRVKERNRDKTSPSAPKYLPACLKNNTFPNKEKVSSEQEDVKIQDTVNEHKDYENTTIEEKIKPVKSFKSSVEDLPIEVKVEQKCTATSRLQNLQKLAKLELEKEGSAHLSIPKPSPIEVWSNKEPISPPDFLLSSNGYPMDSDWPNGLNTASEWSNGQGWPLNDQNVAQWNNAPSTPGQWQNCLITPKQWEINNNFNTYGPVTQVDEFPNSLTTPKQLQSGPITPEEWQNNINEWSNIPSELEQWINGPTAEMWQNSPYAPVEEHSNGQITELWKDGIPIDEWSNTQLCADKTLNKFVNQGYKWLVYPNGPKTLVKNMPNGPSTPEQDLNGKNTPEQWQNDFPTPVYEQSNDPNKLNDRDEWSICPNVPNTPVGKLSNCPSTPEQENDPTTPELWLNGQQQAEEWSNGPETPDYWPNGQIWPQSPRNCPEPTKWNHIVWREDVPDIDEVGAFGSEEPWPSQTVCNAEVAETLTLEGIPAGSEALSDSANVSTVTDEAEFMKGAHNAPHSSETDIPAMNYPASQTEMDGLISPALTHISCPTDLSSNYNVSSNLGSKDSVTNITKYGSKQPLGIPKDSGMGDTYRFSNVHPTPSRLEIPNLRDNVSDFPNDQATAHLRTSTELEKPLQMSKEHPSGIQSPILQVSDFPSVKENHSSESPDILGQFSNIRESKTLSLQRMNKSKDNLSNLLGSIESKLSVIQKNMPNLSDSQKMLRGFSRMHVRNSSPDLHDRLKRVLANDAILAGSCKIDDVDGKLQYIDPKDSDSNQNGPRHTDCSNIDYEKARSDVKTKNNGNYNTCHKNTGPNNAQYEMIPASYNNKETKSDNETKRVDDSRGAGRNYRIQTDNNSAVHEFCNENSSSDNKYPISSIQHKERDFGNAKKEIFVSNDHVANRFQNTPNYNFASSDQNHIRGDENFQNGKYFDPKVDVLDDINNNNSKHILDQNLDHIQNVDKKCKYLQNHAIQSKIHTEKENLKIQHPLNKNYRQGNAIENGFKEDIDIESSIKNLSQRNLTSVNPCNIPSAYVTQNSTSEIHVHENINKEFCRQYSTDPKVSQTNILLKNNLDSEELSYPLPSHDLTSHSQNSTQSMYRKSNSGSQNVLLIPPHEFQNYPRLSQNEPQPRLDFPHYWMLTPPPGYNPESSNVRSFNRALIATSNYSNTAVENDERVHVYYEGIDRRNVKQTGLVNNEIGIAQCKEFVPKNTGEAQGVAQCNDFVPKNTGEAQKCLPKAKLSDNSEKSSKLKDHKKFKSDEEKHFLRNLIMLSRNNTLEKENNENNYNNYIPQNDSVLSKNFNDVNPDEAKRHVNLLVHGLGANVKDPVNLVERNNVSSKLNNCTVKETDIRGNTIHDKQNNYQGVQKNYLCNPERACMSENNIKRNINANKEDTLVTGFNQGNRDNRNPVIHNSRMNKDFNIANREKLFDASVQNKVTSLNVGFFDNVNYNMNSQNQTGETRNMGMYIKQEYSDFNQSRPNNHGHGKNIYNTQNSSHVFNAEGGGRENTGLNYFRRENMSDLGTNCVKQENEKNTYSRIPGGNIVQRRKIARMNTMTDLKPLNEGNPIETPRIPGKEERNTFNERNYNQNNNFHKDKNFNHANVQQNNRHLNNEAGHIVSKEGYKNYHEKNDNKVLSNLEVKHSEANIVRNVPSNYRLTFQPEVDKRDVPAVFGKEKFDFPERIGGRGRGRVIKKVSML